MKYGWEYNWDKMAERCEYFKDKKISELDIEEIEEYLALRKKIFELSESLGKLISKFIDETKDILRKFGGK